MASDPFDFLEKEKPVELPLWREVFYGVDWLRLRFSAAYYGVAVQRGNGDAVITVPGFLGHDLYLTELNLWLRRIGYRPYASRIGLNSECPDLLLDRLLVTIHRAYNERGYVHLVGHSLGGLLARAAAVTEPQYIASVTTLGSPFRGIHSHPRILRTAKRLAKRLERRMYDRPPHKPLLRECFTLDCHCAFSKASRIGLPEHVYETAIYTKSDGVVDWVACTSEDPDVDFEVQGSHVGLAWNPAVYRIIAQRLVEARTFVPARFRKIGVVRKPTGPPIFADYTPDVASNIEPLRPTSGPGFRTSIGGRTHPAGRARTASKPALRAGP